ncbi:lysophospholipase-like fragment [Camelpox virus]|nr:CMLV034 [Camelpox virus]AAG37491.1 CMP34L [Camelpox virus CMS]AAL73741.1 lysophospholipase-like fragment [Camelpox virus M-96]AKU40403.1 hypothetical protein TT95_00045 [Camelpox virus]WIG62239.1 hypothetical protein DIBLKBHL_00040 [Camelpox virus]
MGATISILAAYENPNLFTAMIIMSPLVNVEAVPRLNLLAAKLMGAITPNAPVGTLCPESVSEIWMKFTNTNTTH